MKGKREGAMKLGALRRHLREKGSTRETALGDGDWKCEVSLFWEGSVKVGSDWGATKKVIARIGEPLVVEWERKEDGLIGRPGVTEASLVFEGFRDVNPIVVPVTADALVNETTGDLIGHRYRATFELLEGARGFARKCKRCGGTGQGWDPSRVDSCPVCKGEGVDRNPPEEFEATLVWSKRGGTEVRDGWGTTKAKSAPDGTIFSWTRRTAVGGAKEHPARAVVRDSGGRVFTTLRVRRLTDPDDDRIVYYSTAPTRLSPTSKKKLEVRLFDATGEEVAAPFYERRERVFDDFPKVERVVTDPGGREKAGKRLPTEQEGDSSRSPVRSRSFLAFPGPTARRVPFQR